MNEVFKTPKKTFYFYVLHDCNKNIKVEDFDYLEAVRKAIEIKDGYTFELANDIKNSIDRERELFELDNGIDVRFLQFTGEIKEIDEKSYEEICKLDEKIMSKMSDKSKKLLTEFGFKLDGWHRPFKIEAKNKIYLKTALKRKFGVAPKIIFKYSN